MKKYLIANWKMGLSNHDSIDLALDFKRRLNEFTNKLEIIVAPSFPALCEVEKALKNSNIKLASQDVSEQSQGSFTGEVSAKMVKEFGCVYSIVGHSERRKSQGETDAVIRSKIQQCYRNKIVPILCIGETLAEKESNQRDSVLVRQLHNALDRVAGLPENELLIAYEPVWAIGTGKNLEVSELKVIHRLLKRSISSLYSEKFFDSKVKFLYGGSVSSHNAKEFWNHENINGLLVGTASLHLEEFVSIARNT